MEDEGPQKKKLKLSTSMLGRELLLDVPCVSSLNGVFEKYKEKFVVLYRPPTHSNNTHKTNMDFKAVASVFQQSNPQVKNSFCVENAAHGAE